MKHETAEKLDTLIEEIRCWMKVMEKGQELLNKELLEISQKIHKRINDVLDMLCEHLKAHFKQK